MAWTQDKQQLVSAVQGFTQNLANLINTNGFYVDKYTNGLYGPGGASEITQQDLDDGGITAFDPNTLNLTIQSLDAILRLYKDGENIAVIDDPTVLALVRLGWGINIDRVRST